MQERNNWPSQRTRDRLTKDSIYCVGSPRVCGKMVKMCTYKRSTTAMDMVEVS